MKIHITENPEKIIEGYDMVPIIYGKIEIGKMPDNSIIEIIAIDALDSIPTDLFDNFLEQVVKKMRMGCTITLSGMELDIIARDIVTGKLNYQEFNKIIFNKKAIYSSNEIIKLLIKYDLRIENVNIRGTNYEITAIRPTNKN